MISHEKDNFGNTICDLYSKQNMYKIMLDVISNTHNSCAIVFKNVSKLDLLRFNILNTPMEQISDNMYLYRNNSSCPRLVNGEIIAGGVNMIVNDNGILHSLLVKDIKKSYLTCPGGTSNYLLDPVGARELYEETTGESEGVKYDGIIAQESDLARLAEINFDTKYFDLSVNDRYTMKKHYCSSQKEYSPFINKLLENKQINFENHKEIASVFALPLEKNIINMCNNETLNNEKKRNNLMKIIEKDIDSRLTINMYKHPVTLLHVFLSYAHAFSLLGVEKYSPNIMLQNHIFPKNMRYLRVFW
jgi:hypothetical protein